MNQMWTCFKVSKNDTDTELKMYASSLQSVSAHPVLRIRDLDCIG